MSNSARPYWQFHLSTIVFMTVVAGILVGISTRVRIRKTSEGVIWLRVKGWPYSYQYFQFDSHPNGNKMGELAELGEAEDMMHQMDINSWIYVLGDIMVGVILVALAGAIFEFQFHGRRRDQGL